MLTLNAFPRGITMPIDKTTPPPALATDVMVATELAIDLLGLPFDMARAQYARAVQLGLVERSMLASRDFARTLAAMERLVLGPWARRV